MIKSFTMAVTAPSDNNITSVSFDTFGKHGKYIESFTYNIKASLSYESMLEEVSAKWLELSSIAIDDTNSNKVSKDPHMAILFADMMNYGYIMAVDLTRVSTDRRHK